MEKKKYSKPILSSEMFVPNEYVAACGDNNKVYKFVCDANSGSWFSDGGVVYAETNGKEGLQTILEYDSDKRLGSYRPCSETHDAPTNDEFIEGYLYSLTGGTKKVIIWTDGGTNVHCTANIKMDTWETAKS